MDTTTLFVLIGTGVLVVGTIVTAIVMFKDQTAPIGNPNQRPQQKPVEQSTAPSAHSQLHRPVNFAVSAEVQELLAQDQKIEAIKQVRLETGMGLAEAKSLVDAVLGQADDADRGNIKLARSMAEELVRAGRKIEAIKIWREATGSDLKTAKDEIDRMDSGA